MILILSDEHEPTTDLVIDWLLYYKKDFIRISEENSIKLHSIYKKENAFEAVFIVIKEDNEEIYINTSQVTSFWYRRSRLNVEIPQIYLDNTNFQAIFNSFILEEYESAIRFLYFILSQKKNVNKFEDTYLSKMDVLYEALKLNIPIPDTIICSNKKDLIAFFNKHKGKIITKTIGDPTALYWNDLKLYTSQVNLDEIPDFFCLSLFQEMLDKLFEIRTFYLNGTFFSSAIFSQKDEKTKIDFRQYNEELPNRVVPYKIPVEIENKLRLLMDHLKLNSGSIDIVYTKNHQYVFLEVNPLGQFEQVSFPCNYNLFKEIAIAL